MSEMIQHPVKGVKKIKPPVLIVGGAVAVLGGVLYMRHAAGGSSASSGYSAATDPTATDATGTDSTGLDTSGYYDNSGYGDYTPAPSSLVSYTDPATGQIISGVGSTVLNPATNAQWGQQATAALTNAGYNPITVEAALGKYLLGMGLSSTTQLSIVEAAIGQAGYPPQSVAAPHLAAGVGNSGQGSGTTKSTATMKGGYYVDMKGVHWEARSNKRYYVSPETYKKLAASHIHFTRVDGASQLFKLPAGGTV